MITQNTIEAPLTEFGLSENAEFILEDNFPRYENDSIVSSPKTYSSCSHSTESFYGKDSELKSTHDENDAISPMCITKLDISATKCQELPIDTHLSSIIDSITCDYTAQENNTNSMLSSLAISATSSTMDAAKIVESAVVTVSPDRNRELLNSDETNVAYSEIDQSSDDSSTFQEYEFTKEEDKCAKEPKNMKVVSNPDRDSKSSIQSTVSN